MNSKTSFTYELKFNYTEYPKAIFVFVFLIS